MQVLLQASETLVLLLAEATGNQSLNYLSDLCDLVELSKFGQAVECTGECLVAFVTLSLLLVLVDLDCDVLEHQVEQVRQISLHACIELGIGDVRADSLLEENARQCKHSVEVFNELELLVDEESPHEVPRKE